jgi:hypothetical protein
MTGPGAAGPAGPDPAGPDPAGPDAGADARAEVLGVSASRGHPTHDELAAAAAALLAAARRRTGGRSPSGRTPGRACDDWRATRLAALGLLPRRP